LLTSGRCTHSHPFGKSKGFFSSLIDGSGLPFLIFPSATNFAFSACIRFNNSLAGSSFISCGTSLPITASCSTISLRASMLVSVVNKVSKCAAMRCQFSLNSSAFCDWVRVLSSCSTSFSCTSAALLCWFSSWSHNSISSPTLATIRCCSARGGSGINKPAIDSELRVLPLMALLEFPAIVRAGKTLNKKSLKIL